MAPKRRSFLEKQGMLGRARDMIAAGRSFTEVARELDCPRDTLRSRARREDWYVPALHEKVFPPPVPTRRLAEEVAKPGGAIPPECVPDALEYTRKLMHYALSIIGATPADRSDARWMLGALPNVAKALSSIPDKSADGGEDQEVFQEFDARLVELEKTSRPVPSAHDLGEIPKISKGDAE